MGAPRRLLTAAGLLVWAAIPVAGIVMLRDRADRVALHDPTPTLVEVASDQEATIDQVGLRLRWSEPPALVAPGWTGTVSEVPVAPGDVVRDGTVVVVVDGVARPATRTGRPFTRPLAPGDRGPEVAELNALLARRALPHGIGDRFTDRTARGVVAFSTGLGAAPTFVFDPSWVVYLGVDQATVATAAAAVAHPAPAPGEPVVAFAPTLTTATVIPHQATGAAPETENEVLDGAGATGAPDPTFGEVPALPVPEGATLAVGGLEVPVADRRDQVAERGLATVAGRTPAGDPYVDAEVSTPPRPGEVVVPAAAVVVDGQGQTCVIAGRPGHQHPVPVVVVTGRAGRSIVVPADPKHLRPPTMVEVAPPSARRSCS